MSGEIIQLKVELVADTEQHKVKDIVRAINDILTAHEYIVLSVKPFDTSNPDNEEHHQKY